jgi:Ca-activated chloride channel family protein
VVLGFVWPFAYPEALWALLIVPLLVILLYVGGRFRRAALVRFASMEAIAQLSTLNRRRRGRGRICFGLAVMLLIVTGAGPRWGKGESSIIFGRDLVIVLDLSRSMLTPDMNDANNVERWQAAQAGIHDLVEQVRKKGGHRLGLVVFAAKAWPVCPLTADYDHFLMRLDEFSPLAPPLELQPLPNETFLSGTRIGAGIKEGVVQLHDPRFPGYQDLLLISDGDDPAADRDREIQSGIAAAIDARIPVFVVGVGDPHNVISIIVPSDRGDELVVSELQEAPLKEIARRTEGEYLPAQRQTPKLGDFFRTKIELRPGRDLPEDLIPQPKERYLWFLIPAIVLLLVAWWWEQ